MQPSIFKNPNSPLLWIRKILEVYTAQEQHFNIQILNLWMNSERICPNLSFTVENKMGNLHKKGWSHFKLNINDWDIPFPKSLTIYQWIGKNIFHWGKWKELIWNSAHTTEYLVKTPWKYIFLAYVYKSIALVNELKRLKYLSFMLTIIFCFHFGWEIHVLLDQNSK